MTKHVQCPHCGQAFALTPEQVRRFAGQTITCSQCSEPFLVSGEVAVTGGLATEPSTFETRPFATAGAMPSLAAAGLGALSSGAYADDAYTPPKRYLPQEAPMPPNYAQMQTNGLASASLILGVLGLIVPLVPGLLAIVLGMVALRRARDTDVGAGAALSGIATGTLGLIVSGSLMVTYVMPAITQARETSRAAMCVENLRKIGQSMRTFAELNGGRFPDKLQTAVASGHLKPELLVCPESNDSVAPGVTMTDQSTHLHKGKHVSYTYVGDGLTTQSAPECVLMYETLDRHGEGMHVLFVDGRVQFIGKVEAYKASARLNDGVNPPWTQPGE